MVELFDRFVWLALGITWGWLLCLYLQRRPPQLAAVRPKPDAGTLDADFRNEGVEKKAAGFYGR